MRILAAQRAQKKQHDKKVKSYSDQNPTHRVGDRVMLSAKSLTAPADRNTQWKLRRQWYGPFTVIQVIYADNGGAPVAFQLRLPVHWKMHPVFSAAKLKAYQPPDTEN